MGHMQSEDQHTPEVMSFAGGLGQLVAIKRVQKWLHVVRGNIWQHELLALLLSEIT